MAVEIEEGKIVPFLSYPNKFAELIPGRDGGRTECFPINFELAGGGMGDYICWTPALEWIRDNCPWVHGRIWAPAYFIEFTNHFFKETPNWKVGLIEKISTEAEKGSLLRGLQSTPQQLLNATGSNLLRQGFANFANMDTIPEGTTYPQLNLEDRKEHKSLRGLKGRYVVFTPGGTTQSRFVPARLLNPLIRWVKAQGLTPVFLGKSHMADVHKSYFDDELLWEEGIDLRDKTTLLEAALIMKNALVTLGLDNGLLHLAACTDANLIFAYNIASPRDRSPVRPSGKMIELTVPKEELGCIHCQSNLKLLYTHNFKNCVYKDTKCIELLFSNEGERWKKAIQEFL